MRLGNKISLVVDLALSLMLVVMILRCLIRLQSLAVFVVAERGEEDLL